MKYLFYLIFSKIGFVFSGSGKARLESALSAFTKAQKELQTAISHEEKTVQKANDDLEKERKKFEEKEKNLKELSALHRKIKARSDAYLSKIENFLSIEDDENIEDTPESAKPQDMDGGEMVENVDATTDVAED